MRAELYCSLPAACFFKIYNLKSGIYLPMITLAKDSRKRKYRKGKRRWDMGLRIGDFKKGRGEAEVRRHGEEGRGLLVSCPWSVVRCNKNKGHREKE
jgi:hypothetical protein